MPLSDDQRAMLRLLAQREQGYEDIAALMGLSVDDVRSKVRDALAQLEDEGVETPSVPSPGEPEPKPAEPPAPEPPPLTPPTALEPEIQVATEPARPAAATPPSPPRSSGKSKPSRDNGMLIAIGGGIAGLVVIVVLAVVLISNSGGDDSGGSTSASTGDSTSQEVTNGADSQEVTGATLEAVDGSSASGQVTFGRVKNSLALGVVAKGLEPTGADDSYTIWIAQSPERMLPLAFAEAKNGRIGASYEVPTELLVYLANGTFDQIVVTHTGNKPLEASLKKATEDEKAPVYTGTPVLEGTVTGPIVGAAKRQEEREADKGE
jgi:hypothetical protein